MDFKSSTTRPPLNAITWLCAVTSHHTLLNSIWKNRHYHFLVRTNSSKSSSSARVQILKDVEFWQSHNTTTSSRSRRPRRSMARTFVTTLSSAWHTSRLSVNSFLPLVERWKAYSILPNFPTNTHTHTLSLSLIFLVFVGSYRNLYRNVLPHNTMQSYVPLIRRLMDQVLLEKGGTELRDLKKLSVSLKALLKRGFRFILFFIHHNSLIELFVCSLHWRFWSTCSPRNNSVWSDAVDLDFKQNHVQQIINWSSFSLLVV
jgi:hypothetical protein